MKKIILLIFSMFIFCVNAGYCVIDAATGEDIKGYRGELPDLTERFQRYIPQVARPQFKSVDAFFFKISYTINHREHLSLLLYFGLVA